MVVQSNGQPNIGQWLANCISANILMPSSAWPPACTAELLSAHALLPSLH
jgi:hypothetical protein